MILDFYMLVTYAVENLMSQKDKNGMMNSFFKLWYMAYLANRDSLKASHNQEH